MQGEECGSQKFLVSILSENRSILEVLMAITGNVRKNNTD